MLSIMNVNITDKHTAANI